MNPNTIYKISIHSSQYDHSRAYSFHCISSTSNTTFRAKVLQSMLDKCTDDERPAC